MAKRSQRPDIASILLDRAEAQVLPVRTALATTRATPALWLEERQIAAQILFVATVAIGNQALLLYAHH
ncbi:hypothetical protein AQI95_28735 [Streptomyces yokosukanensis]|uniref:Uncharacterized protein n=1 Tax=Streptomyces yokosukanensis TaxID=67386 RepID=A0A117Q142_9ACTN|nr:hypothetical protein [Streptomyces yokosukanensis]KUN02069.1 hypothetical protein AQI95_28735 [Streptomyces yokosukanensis]